MPKSCICQSDGDSPSPYKHVHNRRKLIKEICSWGKIHSASLESNYKDACLIYLMPEAKAKDSQIRYQSL